MSDVIDRLDRKLDILLQSVHAILQKEIQMSAATDALKADLATLDAKVDAAIAAKSTTDQSAVDALAADEAAIAEIKTTVDSISAKLDQLAPPEAPQS